MLLLLDRSPERMYLVRSAINTVVFPFEYAADFPQSAWHWASQSVTEQHVLLSENVKLQQQVLALQVEKRRLQSLKDENQSLKSLLHAAKQLTTNQYRLAEVMHVRGDQLSREIVLNQGLRANVYIGQPVVDADGVLGQVVSAGAWSSRVLLLSDPESAIPILDQRSGLRAILIGKGEHALMELQHVADTADIHVNDRLLTSGIGGRFPEGYPVGRVVKIVRNPDSAFAKVYVKPEAHMSRGRLVVLVWHQPVSHTQLKQVASDLSKEQTI